MNGLNDMTRQLTDEELLGLTGGTNFVSGEIGVEINLPMYGFPPRSIWERWYPVALYGILPPNMVDLVG